MIFYRDHRGVPPGLGGGAAPVRGEPRAAGRAELMQLDGRYAELFTMQASAYFPELMKLKAK